MAGGLADGNSGHSHLNLGGRLWLQLDHGHATFISAGLWRVDFAH